MCTIISVVKCSVHLYTVVKGLSSFFFLKNVVSAFLNL